MHFITKTKITHLRNKNAINIKAQYDTLALANNKHQSESMNL